MSADRDATILALYRQGLLLKVIAERVGMAPNSIGQVLKRHGIERPGKPQKKRTHIDADSVVSCWDAGRSTAAIAERFGVNRHHVIGILNAAGRNPRAAHRHRYDGAGGTIDRSGNAFARIARRT